jgi:MFS family permease
MIANRWLMLSLLFVVRTSMGFQFQTVGSLGPVLVDTFDIDYTRLGFLIGLYLLPGVVIALPGGMLGDRFGAKSVSIVGLGLMAAGGVLMGLSGSYSILVFARLLSGTGAVLMNVVVTKMIADWFSGREIRTAMAMLVASWPLGIALGLVAFAPLADAFGWQSVMYAAAVLCLAKLTLIVALYHDPNGVEGQTPGALALDLTGREWRLVLIAGFIWGLYNVGYIVLVSFLPALFTHQGETLAEATRTVSLLGWAMIAMVPLGGYLADRTGRPDAVMLVGLFGTAVGAVLMPFGDVTVLAFVLVLLAAGLPAGPIMALPPSALRGEVRGSGMGVYYAWSYALMAALPALAGLAHDMTRNAAAPLVFASLVLVLAVAGLASFRLAASPRTPIGS